MGFTIQDTTFVNTPLEKLIADLILGAETLDSGVAELLTGYRKEISLNRFYVTGKHLSTPPPTGKFGTLINDSFNKDEKDLVVHPFYWENEFNAEDFNVDHKFLWTTGPSGMMQPSQTLLNAITPGVIGNVNDELEEIIWQGDIGGAGSGAALLIDGWDKLLLADATVIPIAPTPITAANVLEEFEKYIQAAAVTNAAILKKGNPSFIVSNKTYALFGEAQREKGIYKGTNFDVAQFDTYGGYKVIGVAGMLDDKVFFGNVGGGESSNLKVGVWADADRTTVEIARTGPLDSTFGVKVRFDVGVEYIYGKEIVYTKA